MRIQFQGPNLKVYHRNWYDYFFFSCFEKLSTLFLISDVSVLPIRHDMKRELNNDFELEYFGILSRSSNPAMHQLDMIIVTSLPFLRMLYGIFEAASKGRIVSDALEQTL